MSEKKLITMEDHWAAINALIECDKTNFPGMNFTDGISDGYHTFGELYAHRAILFATICNMFPDKAWKSKWHHDGTMYDNMFIVGITTPNGQATYHYDIDPYWNYFRVPELDAAPEWDGHSPDDAIKRIYHMVNPNVVKLSQMSWGEAFDKCRNGYAISRKGWNGKNLQVVFQQGYPDGIPCNAQTAEAWGLREGDLFKCDPYLQINTTDGSHAMWVPSIRDLMANDWFVVGYENEDDMNE